MDTNDHNYLPDILDQFNVSYSDVRPFGTGLINMTWKVYGTNENYILQKVNDQVFRRPRDIDNNIRLIADHIQKNHPDYFFVVPVKTRSGSTIHHSGSHGWFRLSPFVEDSVTLDVVQSPAQAYEAALQFGRFSRMLSGIDTSKLKVTIPDFHNLTLRYEQFKAAVENGNPSRRSESDNLIEKLFARKTIVDEFEKKIADPSFRVRVTHHDTKISNILFDKNFRGICVIDLDTVMPGHFFSDVGDMMRTYLSPVSEEEKDFSMIEIRKPFYHAIVKGYNEAMQGELTNEEKNSFLFAGRFMIYMQALRFLTDHLNDDAYYGAKYTGHNFMRAGNQLTLLEKLEAMDPD